MDAGYWMRFKAALIATTPFWAAIVALPPLAYAGAPPAVERFQESPKPNALDRERAYAGLSLGEAIRQALIEGDTDFALTTMGAFARATGNASTPKYFSAVRAFSQKNYAEVISALEGSDKDDFLTSALLTWAQVAQGQFEAAKGTWDSYGVSGQKPFYHGYRALLAEQGGDTDLALEHYEKAAKQGELMFAKDLAQRYCILLARAGKTDAALSTFQAIFGELNELSVQESTFRATLIGPSLPAVEPITPVKALSTLLSNYGATLRMSRMVLARPNNDDPTNASSAPLEESDPDASFVSDAIVLRTALAIDPTNDGARVAMTQLLSYQDEDEAALKTIQAITDGPKLNEAHWLTADIQLDLENPKAGLARLELVTPPYRDSSWLGLKADLLAAGGDFDAALEAARQSAALAQDKGEWTSSVAQLSLAQALYNKEDNAGAVAIARTLIKNLKRDNPLRGAAGRFLAANAATFEEGLPFARESLNAFGADAKTRIHLGAILVDQTATRAEGIQLIRDGLAALPRSPMAMNALGFALVDYDIDLEEGFLLLQKAHDLRPNSGAISDSLGWAHYKLGQLDEAQRLIEQAVKLRTDAPDPEIYENLGDVYWHQGKRDKARQMWQKAKDFGGNYRRARQLDDKLKSGLKTPVPTKQAPPVRVEPGSV
jgi:tetratricopeptide (TPR) repeat protein